jgi:hypothetical protein
MLDVANDSVSGPSAFLVLGQQPRHTACDRCRSQKVKCLRGDSDNISACERCQRAGADCVQTSKGRIGRPTTYNKRGKKLAHRRSATGSISETLGSPTTLDDVGSVQESAAETDGRSHAEEYGKGYASSTDAQDHEFGREDIPWSSSVTAFDSQLSASGEKDDPFDFFATSGTLHGNMYNFDMMSAAAELPQLVMDSLTPGSLQFCSIGGLNSMNTATAQPTSVDVSQAVDSDSTSAPGTQFQSNQARKTSPLSKPTVEALFTLTTSLQDLMEMTSHDPAKDPSGPLQLQDCHIDEILRTTQAFLDVIGAYHEPHKPNIITPAPGSSQGYEGASHHRPRPERPDIHTYLIIVSCYTRLLKVYSNLVYYIHERVQSENGHPLSLSSSSCGARRALPALQLGTTTIQDDMSLQAVLIVRVGARMIQRLEDAMAAMLISHADQQDDDYKGAGGSTAEQAPSRAYGGHLPKGCVAATAVSPVHFRRSSASSSASRQQVRDGLGSRGGGLGNDGGSLPANYMKIIIDSAIGQEDRDSLARGQSGIGSLEKTIEAVEKLLR